MKNEHVQVLTQDFLAPKAKDSTVQIFWENEIKANLLVGRFMLACAAGLVLCWLLNALGVLEISRKYVLETFPVGITLFLIPAVICLALKGRKKWIKYLTMLSLILTLAYLDSILTFNVTLLIVIPVVFSCWYYSSTFTVQVALLTTVFFACSAFCGAYFNMATPDLNFAEGDMSGYIRDVMLMSFLPRWIIFVLISSVCYVIAARGRKLVFEQDTVSQSQARVETELDMASKIQAQALPAVSELSVCQCRQFDLAAKMQPAREVGGDFYDFVYLDETHLALIVADVADKGIAAALYMMMSKLMLDNKLTVCHSPGLVLEEVNRQLHKKSLQGMFVTVWLGVLDLETGDLVSASAGHEYPILKHGSGDFELFRDRHGFVLGGVEDMRYEETRLHLDEGDALFVYTDGAVEANAPDGTQFGEARLLAALNRHKDADMETLIAAVKQEIDGFAADTPQFDDITMLALRLHGPIGNNVITVAPVLDELYPVQDYIREVIGEDKIPPIQLQKIGIAVDEIFSNIVKYSQAGEVQVLCTVEDNRIQITFRDDGIPFDPLTTDISVTPTPKVTGGLGIYITRTIMDHVDYKYQSNRNNLTITLNIKENAE